MKARHTPGPWMMVWEEPPFKPWPCWSIKRNDDVKHPVAIVVEPGGPKSPQEANARLICAAPELLVALKDVKRYCPVDVQARIEAMVGSIEGKA